MARPGRIGNDLDRRRRQLRRAERRVAGSQRQRWIDDRRSGHDQQFNVSNRHRVERAAHDR